MPVDATLLDKVPLLAGLDTRARARIAETMKERSVPAGARVMGEGSPGIAFFIVLEGEASVDIGGAEVQKLVPGDYVGEMALLDPDAPRSATVTATSDLRLAHMTSWEFKPFVMEHPEVAWSLLQVLARRTRAAQQRQPA